MLFVLKERNKLSMRMKVNFLNIFFHILAYFLLLALVAKCRENSKTHFFHLIKIMQKCKKPKKWHSVKWALDVGLIEIDEN